MCVPEPPEAQFAEETFWFVWGIESKAGFKQVFQPVFYLFLFVYSHLGFLWPNSLACIANSGLARWVCTR